MRKMSFLCHHILKIFIVKEVSKMLQFVICVFIGACVGFVLFSLMSASNSGDEDDFI